MGDDVTGGSTAKVGEAGEADAGAADADLSAAGSAAAAAAAPSTAFKAAAGGSPVAACDQDTPDIFQKGDIVWLGGRTAKLRDPAESTVAGDGCEASPSSAGLSTGVAGESVLASGESTRLGGPSPKLKAEMVDQLFLAPCSPDPPAEAAPLLASMPSPKLKLVAGDCDAVATVAIAAGLG